MSTRASPSPAASSRSKPVIASSSNSSISSSHQQNTSAPPQTDTPPPTAPAASTSKAPRRPSTSGPSSSKAPDVQEKSRRSPSTASLKQKSSKNLDEMSAANKNEELIANYAKDFENIRAIISCKICTRCLYEPYIVACGHTYCYSCLMNWWGSSKKKTCPDCRTTVTQVPAPNYLVREMVGVFLNRPGTLAPGESIEQLKAEQKEEFEILQKDRDNQDPRRGGLFRGLFSTLGRRNFLQRAAVQDAQDGVDRCPECLWELEEGECGQCGFQLGAAWDQNIENYSDLDHSELGGSSEEMDGDVEIDDDFDDADYPGGDDYDAFMDTFGGLAGVDMPNGEMLRRYLARDHAAMGHQGMFIPRRRPAAHSAAGSRRRYSASIASDMISEDHEMEALEEEDEADEDDEDSSMNDFLDDGTEHGSEASTSTDSQTPQPAARTTASQLPGNRNRRVVRSESRSTSYASTPGLDEDDEDEDEEGGPIPPGRQRRQQRMLARANGSFRTASSVSTEASADNELDEDTQRLLERQGWSPLQQYGTEEEMEEEGDEDESDGGRTTVGWDPTAISSARPRNTNSLTPATDRPLQTRPRSRAGQSRMIDGSRGLRRRSSNMSVSTVNYEDGEADDDLSEVDRDGDTVMQSQQLRPRASRVRLHAPIQSPTTRRSTNPSSLGDGMDGDTDDNSDDASMQSPRRTQLNRSRQAYDPRISLMFAQHQNTVQAYQNTVQASLNNRLNWLEEELRANTPIGRPRTANRNRPSRTTTPVTLDAHPFNASPFASAISPRSRRAVDQASTAETGDALARIERQASVRSDVTSMSGSTLTNGSRVDRRGSVISISSSSAAPDSANNHPHPQRSTDTFPTNLVPTPEDIIERPASRLPARPPSANGRRGSQGQIPNYSSLQMSPGPGLNYAQRTWQQQNRNPYFTGMLGPRQRPSSQRLREQSSTATLRASGSRRALRTQPSRDDVDDEVPAVRAQRSRVNLRSPPSVQRLQAQPSIRVLRQADGVQLHHPGLPHPGGAAASRPVASSLLPEEERQRRANELVRTRQRELRNATNPFAANGRRPSVSNSPNESPAPGPTINYNNGQPVLAPPPSVGVSAASNSPASRPTAPGNPSGQATLNRRRSARNMGLPPSVLPPAQSTTGHAGSRNRLPNQIHHSPVTNSNGVHRAVMANYAA